MILWGIFLSLHSVSTGLSDPGIECRGTVNAYVIAFLLLHLRFGISAGVEIRLAGGGRRRGSRW